MAYIKCGVVTKINIEKNKKQAIDYLNTKTKNIHLSFDIDSINKNECPGVNVPNRWSRGLKKEEAILAFSEFYKKLNVVSLDIVEYNPLQDKNDKSLNIVLEAIEIINKK